MDRKEVEALLAETKDPMIAALCRTQLAVWDAPVGITAWDEPVGITDWDASVLIVEFADDDPAGWNQGQRVRIVPEGE